jgi:hypothetical protein
MATASFVMGLATLQSGQNHSGDHEDFRSAVPHLEQIGIIVALTLGLSHALAVVSTCASTAQSRILHCRAPTDESVGHK